MNILAEDVGWMITTLVVFMSSVVLAMDLVWRIVKISSRLLMVMSGLVMMVGTTAIVVVFMAG